jgi:hypothetical protein
MSALGPTTGVATTMPASISAISCDAYLPRAWEWGQYIVAEDDVAGEMRVRPFLEHMACRAEGKQHLWGGVVDDAL